MRVVSVSPGKQRRREAHGQPAQRARIVQAGCLEHRAPGEGHRAEAVHDPTREPDGPRELVVEVDREVVTRGGRVADRLILGHRVRDLRVRRPLGGEAMVRGAISDALGCHDPAEELRHVLLVQELAVSVRVSVRITTDVPVGRPRTATGVALEWTRIPPASGRCRTRSCS